MWESFLSGVTDSFRRLLVSPSNNFCPLIVAFSLTMCTHPHMHTCTPSQSHLHHSNRLCTLPTTKVIIATWIILHLDSICRAIVWWSPPWVDSRSVALLFPLAPWQPLDWRNLCRERSDQSVLLYQRESTSTKGSNGTEKLILVIVYTLFNSRDDCIQRWSHGSVIIIRYQCELANHIYKICNNMTSSVLHIQKFMTARINYNHAATLWHASM